ncbi:hypothetical protein [Mycobacterium talmoniae]|uniref:Uncharacterized protein n=1 Tax=Mycobacterium talmoniae TaxID=1858794 RepID=A0A1S1NMV0_9MYCO|nr:MULTISPECIES: hypothetical protein [Mycobacterium]OHV05323.1 hypothetical protein BKN37_06140 [Mycobacterium talmoniae]PQM44026.1 hypothetical protein C1Y40_05816 [Mycobacterium talmoniae]TDH48314.1 hypothetical protein E2F47_24270 [Mycobacterium eburneum]
MYPPRQSPGVLAVRIVTGVVGGAAALLWLLLAFAVLSSRFDTNPAGDPHGYVLLFGTLMSVPVGAVCAATLPFAFPRQRWPLGFAVVVPAFVVGTVLLFAAFLTAH